jgi:hypothetical protein
MNEAIEPRDHRAFICKVISEMLDNPDKNGIYPTTKAYDRLEHYINAVEYEAGELGRQVNE